MTECIHCHVRNKEFAQSEYRPMLIIYRKNAQKMRQKADKNSRNYIMHLLHGMSLIFLIRYIKE